jgi:hypothetical protein
MTIPRIEGLGHGIVRASDRTRPGLMALVECPQARNRSSPMAGSVATVDLTERTRIAVQLLGDLLDVLIKRCGINAIAHGRNDSALAVDEEGLRVGSHIPLRGGLSFGIDD